MGKRLLHERGGVLRASAMLPAGALVLSMLTSSPAAAEASTRETHSTAAYDSCANWPGLLAIGDQGNQVQSLEGHRGRRAADTAWAAVRQIVDSTVEQYGGLDSGDSLRVSVFVAARSLHGAEAANREAAHLADEAGGELDMEVVQSYGQQPGAYPGEDGLLTIQVTCDQDPATDFTKASRPTPVQTGFSPASNGPGPAY